MVRQAIYGRRYVQLLLFPTADTAERWCAVYKREKLDNNFPLSPNYLFYSCRSHLTFIVSSINTRQFPFLLFSILLLRQFHIHNNAMTQLDNKIEKELLRKLDRRLVAWAALAYFSNVLLRNNMRKCSIIVFIKSGNRHWRIIHVPYYELISTRIYQWHEHWPSSEFICL